MIFEYDTFLRRSDTNELSLTYFLLKCAFKMVSDISFKNALVLMYFLYLSFDGDSKRGHRKYEMNYKISQEIPDSLSRIDISSLLLRSTNITYAVHK